MRSIGVDVAEAEEFLRLFHAEQPDAGSLTRRLEQVRREAELTFGARVAWRNSARCIGRLYWKSLRVRDLRAVHSASGVAAECVRHLQISTNGGKVRPMISVFPQATP